MERLHINKFRLFRNTDFILGKYITVFSGTNAVGKSTLLGILGNSSELKVKYGRPILQKQFRTEFSEIFKKHQQFF
ncbi:AAA family ATPase [Megasphaera hominis]|uniref:AAA family ATPase n=1 Tax=Megasphaera hominis TaxID=159836 RepID=A0ABR6VLU7_9FIRM|nr:AAA family ATPase [Megasphaera hominis]